MRVSFTGLLRARLKEIHNVNANVGMVRLGMEGVQHSVTTSNYGHKLVVDNGYAGWIDR